MDFRQSRIVRAWAPVEESPVDAVLRARRESGGEVISLLGNFGQAGCPSFPAERFAEIVGAARPGPYAPDPLGQLVARAAIASYYGGVGWPVAPENLLLTPGTSLGYFYALRILTAPGDDVLVPKPGYPLFDDLCLMLGITPRAYHLRPTASGWALDVEELAFQVTPRTRAIVMVSPHNPTGDVPDAATLQAVGRICRESGIALLFDEVFAEYSPAPFPRPSPQDFPLLLVLNGLSKMLALPGAKIAWLAAAGDVENVRSFLHTAAHLSDTFLPVSEIMQAALPGVMAEGIDVTISQLRDAVKHRRNIAREVLGANVAAPDAGTYFTVPLANGADDIAAAARAAERGIHLHPGSFYGLPPSLVGTVTNPEWELREGCERLKDLINSDLRPA